MFADKPETLTPTAQILTAEGLPDPEALARFLDGPGCLHCLKDWWPSDAMPSVAPNSGETGGRYLCRSESSRLRFRREAAGDGTAAIWSSWNGSPRVWDGKGRRMSMRASRLWRRTKRRSTG